MANADGLSYEWPIINKKSLGTVFALLLIVFSGNLLSQQPSMPTGMLDLRYDTLRNSPSRNLTTPGNEFGDQHGLQNGSLSLNVVDVSIPGNNELPVEFRRILRLTEGAIPSGQTLWVKPGSRMNSWAFGLPKIEAVYDEQQGWVTSDQSRPTKNCSVAQLTSITPPPGLHYPNLFPPAAFWQPATIHFPDGTSRLLAYNDGSMSSPSSGGPYFWVTAGMDYVSCLNSLKNAGGSTAEEQRFGGGEGYLVRRPDGTRYWFDWVAVDRRIPSFSAEWYSHSCGPLGGSICYATRPVFLRQVALSLYPTRVEDRFGNWVTYTYSNKSNEYVKLDRIESSDGRVITVSYSGDSVSTVSAGGKIWRYQAAGDQYTVENPDGSQWRYTGNSHPYVAWPFGRTGPEGRCQDLSWTSHQNIDYTAGGNPRAVGFTVQSPSGATAVFKVEGVMLGRSGVLRQCHMSGWAIRGGYELFQITAPSVNLGNYRLALVSKEVSGPGLSPMEWRYNYQSDIGYLPFTGGESRTKILNPDGSVDRYIYGNVHRVNEGVLLLNEKVSPQGVIQSTQNSYATAGAGVAGFPRRIGGHVYPDADYGSLNLRPLVKSEVLRNSHRFLWEVDTSCGTSGRSHCLDHFGRHTRVRKESSPSL